MLLLKMVVMLAPPNKVEPELMVSIPLNLRVLVEALLTDTVFPLALLIVTFEKLLVLLLLIISVFVLPVKVTPQFPMEMADPVENSQFPESSMALLMYPEMEEVEPQVMFTATSFPVRVRAPPMLNAPFIVAFPEAVSVPLFNVVALMVRVAPEFTVRFWQTPGAPERVGWFAGADGITTSSTAVGTCPSDQFVATVQDTLVEPSQVFVCAHRLPAIINKATMANNTGLFFMGLGFSYAIFVSDECSGRVFTAFPLTFASFQPEIKPVKTFTKIMRQTAKCKKLY
jgi:hypothetical protein